jgi:hypothetical protein
MVHLRFHIIKECIYGWPPTGDPSMMINGSLFSQVLSLVPRLDFAKLVRVYGTEMASKGFGSWDHFTALMFSQLAGANSLREISGGLASCLGKLVHLGGIKKAPARSTLSYANNHRPWEFFQAVFHLVLGEAQGLAKSKGRRFRFKNPLYSLDATTIDLCLKVFDWARYKRTKGAVKLHLLLDHQGHLPCWAYISDGKTGDVTAAWLLSLVAGAIVVMDRGYNDFSLFGSWSARGVYFVTRMKEGTLYEVVERKDVPSGSNVLSDEVIRLTGKGAEEKCPNLLRRVVVWDEEKKREIVLLTNILHLAARTIGDVYKARWQIELFFKALKQNLKVKTFLGTSENAVKSQLWTALTAMLILKFLQLKSKLEWSLSNLAALFRMNLMVYKDLWEWIDAPFGVAAESDDEVDRQLCLFALK